MQGTNPIKAALWMLGAIASFSAMAVAGREIAAELDTFELMMYRSAIGFLVVLGLLALPRGGGYAQVRTAHPGQHLARNVVHFAGQNLWFFGVATIPLSQLVALEFTNPIWVALLAPLFLGEQMTRVRVLAAGIGFIGILIVAQPGVAPLEWGHAAGLGAAVGFALNTLFTKRIMRHDTVLCVLFWMTLLQGLFGLALALPGGIAVPSQAMLPWVLIVSVCGLTAHFCLTSALQFAPASVVAPMEFLRLPVIALLGMWVYHEPLMAPVFVGAALILAGNVISVRAERRRAGREAAGAVPH
ncbi:DMT family transporter [Oceanicella sp. SM1341]|uniref:DMT family transporter n=1 Tax=Oceanicella sp. SM1341 TaxID=1548889 RepID=UPI000E4C64D6|nr:DMT family transporter [Oceanicella sp. SM1341]